MNKTFVMRGQVADFRGAGAFETLNFSGFTPGIAYRLVEFRVWPSNGTNTNDEIDASITAAKTPADPSTPDYRQEGLIGTACWENNSSEQYGPNFASLVNDTFMITQDLLLTANDYQGSSPINFHCKFVGEKMSSNEEAVTNFRQYTISNDD